MKVVDNGVLSGVARPTPGLRQRMRLLYGKSAVERLDQIVEDTTAIDALSRLLTEAMEKCQTKDGRVDMKDVAAFVLGEMKRHPK
ncbi:MAG TPA: hypothetical protein VE967_19705 [Gemmatimonadaceae bacterium]|nr:hypothetical protein [Gemmatimonadaceae bacterium]